MNNEQIKMHAITQILVHLTTLFHHLQCVGLFTQCTTNTGKVNGDKVFS